MKSHERERILNASPSFLADQIARLSELFPEAVSEGKVDFDKLRATLGDEVDGQPERYSFSWAGKRDAIRLLQTPSRATLIPCPEESVEFGSTQNLFIEGENLEVLKLLYKSYFGRVKLIYIDPPYNTGNDFIYPDNYADPLDTYLKLTGQKDSEGNLLTSNPETSGRYHSAWLTMMYPRLLVAKQLLRDDGLLFVSIDDHEIYNLRQILNEIFGEENSVGTLIWKRRQNVDSRAKTGMSMDHEYVLMYRKNGESRLRGQEKDLSKYGNPDGDPRGDWMSADLTGLATKEQRPNLHYELINPATGIAYPCPPNGWRYSPARMARLIEDNRIIWPPVPTGRPRLRKYVEELSDEFTGLSSVLQTVFNTQGTRELKELFDDVEVLDFPKPVEYIRLLTEQATSKDEPDLVLDFFAGSATTAHAAFVQNRADRGIRRFVMVQLPEPTFRVREDGDMEQTAAYRAGYKTIAEIGKERVRRVIKKMKAEGEGKLELSERETPEDLGFRVFKLAESNMRTWKGVEEKDPEAYAAQMEAFSDPLIEGWTTDKVIWEVAIREGFALTSRVKNLEAIGPNTVYLVSDPDKNQCFRLCLDDTFDMETARALNLGKEDLFICRDIALTDETAANLALQCRLKVI